MADKINIEITGTISALEAAMAESMGLIKQLGQTVNNVSQDFSHLEIDWNKYTIAAQNADNETIKFINTTNGLTNVFSRVRNELEQIEVAWGQAIVEKGTRAKKAVDDLNRSE